ncbi:putative membrane protein [Kitasatospora sp. GP30]|uniref:SHOCT domain-containing protein n=1 Tax=Kitasatospora sp. GP30 TaxID=3035084 RepID=UPI000C70B2EA|nr:hypothetical protein [Kitasatospora sp. GP30]MDH6144314.1 putative membrane protein [Kitasatospora sp. GP30]
MMFWDDHGMSGWGFGLMTTAMLIFWVLIILGAVMLFRQLGRAPHHGGAGAEHRPPERLLAERFARGEIDTDEYRRRPETLRSGPGPGDG